MKDVISLVVIVLVFAVAYQFIGDTSTLTSL
jgi:hypothetical protein